METLNNTRARAFRSLAPYLALTASMLAHQLRPHGPKKDGEEDEDDRPDDRSLQSLITRAGTAEAAANELWRDNYTLRDQRRKLREQVKDLEAAKPPEGSVLLTKEQAADWEAYQKLGKPADLQKAMDDGKTAAEALTKHERTTAVTAAAKSMGYNPEVLVQLMDLHKLELAATTVKVDGKDVTTYNVKAEGGQPTELTQYAAANWAAFMPSLKGTEQAGGAQDGGGAAAGAGGGQQWLPQGGASGQSGAANDAAALAQQLVAARAGTTGEKKDGGGQNTGGQQGPLPGGPGGPAGPA